MRRLDIYDRASAIAVAGAVLLGAAAAAAQLRPSRGLVSRLEGTPIWNWTAQAPALVEPPVPAPDQEPDLPYVPGPSPAEEVGALGGVAAIKLVVARTEEATGPSVDAGDETGTEPAALTCPQLEVLVNGSPVADFRYGAAWVVANRGDLVELRLEAGCDSVQVRVESALGQVTNPQAGFSVTAAPGVTELGNIMM